MTIEIVSSDNRWPAVIQDERAEVRPLGTRAFYDALLNALGYSWIDSATNDLLIAMYGRVRTVFIERVIEARVNATGVPYSPGNRR